MKKIIVRCTTFDSMLGMSPGNLEAAQDFLELRKAKNEKARAQIDAHSKEEIKALKLAIDQMKVENMEKGVSIFPVDNQGRPMYWKYQMQGFIKDNAIALKDVIYKGDVKNKLPEVFKCFQKFNKMPRPWVDRGVFVLQEEIPVIVPNGAETSFCTRILRTQDKRTGVETTAFKTSQSVPPGCKVTFSIGVLNDPDMDYVMAILHFGFLRGFGEWRNSGKGRFTFEIYNEEKKMWEPQPPAVTEIFDSALPTDPEGEEIVQVDD